MWEVTSRSLDGFEAYFIGKKVFSSTGTINLVPNPWLRKLQVWEGKLLMFGSMDLSSSDLLNSYV